MRAVPWTDETGRKFLMEIPDAASDEQAQMGIVLGPLCDLEPLNLPEEIAVRLHNALYDRGVFTAHDARRRTSDVAAAVRLAFNSEVRAVVSAFEAR